MPDAKSSNHDNAEYFIHIGVGIGEWRRCKAAARFCNLPKSLPWSSGDSGSVVVRMVRELLGRHLGVELALVDALNVKFLQVIDPVEYPEITVRFLKIDREDGGALKVSAAVSAGETTLCKLLLRFR